MRSSFLPTYPTFHHNLNVDQRVVTVCDGKCYSDDADDDTDVDDADDDTTDVDNTDDDTTDDDTTDVDNVDDNKLTLCAKRGVLASRNSRANRESVIQLQCVSSRVVIIMMVMMMATMMVIMLIIKMEATLNQQRIIDSPKMLVSFNTCRQVRVQFHKCKSVSSS